MVIGVIGVLVISVVALAAAGVILASGWQAGRDELLRRNFRSQPPSLRGRALTLVGVALPVLLITLLLLALVGWLLHLLFTQP